MRWWKFGTYLIIIMINGCTSSGVVELQENSSGCSGLLPVTSLNNKGINVELTNLIVQEAATGKFKVEYTDTMKALLSDEVLAHWVREEMICQGARTFESPEQRIWFITMKEMSEKGSSQEFLQWLSENPFDPFKKGKASDISLDQDLNPKIKYINGQIILPTNAFSANIESIHSSGVLIVPGPTKVTIGYCNGKISHHVNAKIIISSSHSSCRQENLK